MIMPTRQLKFSITPAKSIGFAVTSIALGFLITAPAQAANLYGNSATSSGSNPISTIDTTTGTETARFVGSGNGRGVVTVGNTIYYTVTDDSKIYKKDLITGANNGFIQTKNTSMATLAWDGANFWTADYSGTNKAFQIDINGNNIKTISLANARQYMDGLEYFNGKLIGNREDGGGIYDVYDLNGNVLQANFLTNTSAKNNTGVYSTGIAYDGKDFYVSNIKESSVGIYDGTTGLFKSTLALTPKVSGNTFLIEDLSFDYAARQDTGGTQVPEPFTIVGTLLGCAAAFRMKKRLKVTNKL
jgi:hypothetical protein